MVDSLSTSVDSALDDDQISFIAKDEQIKLHSVDLSGMRRLSKVCVGLSILYAQINGILWC